MRRRDFLALSAGLAGLAGCAGPAGTRTLPTPLGTRGSGGGRDFGQEVSSGTASVTVWDASVRTSEYYRTAEGVLDVYAPANAHLVFVRVTARGSRPPLSSFELAVGDSSYDPLSAVAGRPLSALQHRYRPYDPDADPSSTGQWLVFEVPAARPARTAAVVWTGPENAPARWALPDDQTAALREPVPSFALDRFEVPSTVPADGSPTARLRVSNTSGSGGPFRAALNYSGAIDAAETHSFAVPAGETVAKEFDLAWTGQRIDVELGWAGPNERRTIEPAGES